MPIFCGEFTRWLFAEAPRSIRSAARSSCVRHCGRRRAGVRLGNAHAGNPIARNRISAGNWTDRDAWMPRTPPDPQGSPIRYAWKYGSSRRRDRRSDVYLEEVKDLALACTRARSLPRPCDGSPTYAVLNVHVDHMRASRPLRARLPLSAITTPIHLRRHRKDQLMGTRCKFDDRPLIPFRAGRGATG